MIETVNTEGELYELLMNHEHAPSGVPRGAVERLVDVAKERTRTRNDHSFDSKAKKDYLFTTSWDGLCEDKLGYDSSHNINRFALGTLDGESPSGKALFVHEAVVPQWNWLATGDDRLTKLKPVDMTDTEYQSLPGRMNWPKAYTVIIEFVDELVCHEPRIEHAF